MSLDVVTEASALETRLAPARAGGGLIGFVPTMGALHEGHASLVRQARKDCATVVASIFVNPTQFGPGEDFERYPRQAEADARILEDLGCDVLYLPAVEDMYPPGFSTRVEMQGLTEVLCGAHRPGHFSGVLTVVLKLLNRVRPHRAYFGRKDHQQAVVIGRMVRDLDMQAEVVACPIVREPDGLALSSRNAYLAPEERERALALPRALEAVDAAFRGGERAPRTLLATGRRVLEEVPGLETEYLDLRDPEDLSERQEAARPGDLVAAAVHVGGTRLIDNRLLGRDA